MNILVATKKTQGQRDNDFCHTREAELIMFASECDHDEDPDGKCGCKRSMAGVSSLKATTTMRITRTEITEQAYARAIKRAMDEGGWTELIGEEKTRKQATLDARELLRIARTFPIDTIVEKRGDTFRERAAKTVWVERKKAEQEKDVIIEGSQWTPKGKKSTWEVMGVNGSDVIIARDDIPNPGHATDKYNRIIDRDEFLKRFKPTGKYPDTQEKIMNVTAEDIDAYWAKRTDKEKKLMLENTGSFSGPEERNKKVSDMGLSQQDVMESMITEIIARERR